MVPGDQASCRRLQLDSLTHGERLRDICQRQVVVDFANALGAGTSSGDAWCADTWLVLAALANEGVVKAEPPQLQLPGDERRWSHGLTMEVQRVLGISADM
jgi:hypothetical protein